VVAFKPKACPSLLDALAGTDTSTFGVLLIGCVCHFLAMTAVLLKLNCKTDLCNFVSGAVVYDITNALAIAPEEHHVVQDNLVDGVVSESINR
jgi:hypothetical protein